MSILYRVLGCLVLVPFSFSLHSGFAPFLAANGDLALHQVKDDIGGNISALQTARPSTNEHKHKVQHVALLNNHCFWWLMGMLITCVAIAVVKVEVNGRPSATQEGSIHTAAEEHPTSRSSSSSWWDDFASLVFCVVGLHICMLFWGVAQEFVMTNKYADRTGLKNPQAMPSTLFIVLCNRLCSILFAGCLCKLRGKQLYFTGFWSSAMPAVSNTLSSWCQYGSLHYVSFTLQTTAKSGKLLPVVVLGSIRGKKYSILDYAETIIIVSALVVFGLETTEQNSDSTQMTVLGVILIGCLLLCDSLTPHLQDGLFKYYPEMDPIQATFGMSCVASVSMLIVLILNGSLLRSLDFLWTHDEAVLHILVLSLSSTVTQYLISYTIKNFGPVVFTLIASTRQVISVCLSAVLFQHHIADVGIVAVILIFCTVIVRAVRPFTSHPEEQSVVRRRDAASRSCDRESMMFDLFGSHTTAYGPLLLCTLAIHVLYCFYALAQEFLATHTFSGEIFAYPMFMILVNHVCAAAFAFVALRLQAVPVFVPSLRLTLLPACSNLISTFLQHRALYLLFFPAQTLMKTLKVIPVMLVGRLLRNRCYNMLDYAEGLLISGVVAFFVWDFQIDRADNKAGDVAGSTIGIILMIGYIIADSFTSNFEDFVYQVSRIDAGQMLFGMELSSGLAALVTLVADGQLVKSIMFLYRHPGATFYVILLAIASASGAYTCTLTVRLYGPAVFTLIMMSRQVLSLVISVTVFQHSVNGLHCLLLVVIAVLILTSSIRRVKVQVEAHDLLKQNNEPDAGNKAERKPPVESEADRGEMSKPCTFAS